MRSRDRFRRAAGALLLALSSVPATLTAPAVLAVEAAPAAPPAGLEPGIDLFKAKKFVEAKTFFEAAVVKSSSDAEAAYYLGRSCVATDDVDKALEQAAEIKKRDSLKGHYSYVRVYRDQKKNDLAEQELLAAAKESPSDTGPRIQLGFFYQGLERYDDAFRVFEEILKADASHMMALYQVGRTGAMSGKNLDRAAECLKTYMQHTPGEGEPSFAYAHFRLGQVFEKMGRLDAAKQEYSAALQVDPNHKDAKAALKKLS
jgi:tetratricopeptide (TPR) repeat protein